MKTILMLTILLLGVQGQARVPVDAATQQRGKRLPEGLEVIETM